ARAMRPPPGEPWVCAECGALSVQEMPGVTPDDQRRWLDALDALFWDGDGAAGATAARAMRARLARNAGTTGALDTDRCILGLWHRVRGEPGRGEIPSAPGKAGSVDLRAALPFCVMLLEAMDAVAGKRSDAGAALARADSAWLHFPRVAFVRNANEGACELTAAGNMVLARLYETRGDLAGALARIRRRPLAYDAGVWYLSTGLREEGRLAALAGDRAEAVRAYRHYLALRSNPEPELQPGVERVRAELERLESVT
ncbi:MAG TPA: hypothetical protein VFU46_11555, partial [Gemmatimonadales bacterium]|nr:hypothetical protein [Gemmatimonadales bacterium]